MSTRIFAAVVLGSGEYTYSLQTNLSVVSLYVADEDGAWEELDYAPGDGLDLADVASVLKARIERGQAPDLSGVLADLRAPESEVTR